VPSLISSVKKKPEGSWAMTSAVAFPLVLGLVAAHVTFSALSAKAATQAAIDAVTLAGPNTLHAADQFDAIASR